MPTFLPNTDEDRAGLIVIFAAVGICWSVTVLVSRLCGSLLRRHGLNVGDWTIVTLTVSCWCCEREQLLTFQFIGTSCSIAVFVAVKYGLGKRAYLRDTSYDYSAAKV